jgi:hypothetical protein
MGILCARLCAVLGSFPGSWICSLKNGYSVKPEGRAQDVRMAVGSAGAKNTWKPIEREYLPLAMQTSPASFATFSVGVDTREAARKICQDGT